MACLKKKIGTDAPAKKVFPEPEQYKVPTCDVVILDAEFDSHLMDEMSERQTYFDHQSRHWPSAWESH